MANFNVSAPLSGILGRGTHQLVSEQLDLAWEAGGEGRASGQGSRHGSSADRSIFAREMRLQALEVFRGRSSSHGGSGGGSPEGRRVLAAEERISSLEDSIGTLAGTVLDFNGRFDKFEERFDKFDRMLEELARSKRNPEVLNQDLNQTPSLHHSIATQPVIKFKLPDYDGEGNVNVWLLRIGHYFNCYNIPEEDRIEICSVQLKGPAAYWLEWIMKIRNGMLSWEEFCKSIRREFDPSQFTDHMMDLKLLQQDGNVQEYNSHFQKLSKKIHGLSEYCLVRQYVGGLKEEVRYEVQVANPINLPAAMRLAILSEAKITAAKRHYQTPTYPSRIQQEVPTMQVVSTENPRKNTYVLNSTGTLPGDHHQFLMQQEEDPIVQSVSTEGQKSTASQLAGTKTQSEVNSSRNKMFSSELDTLDTGEQVSEENEELGSSPQGCVKISLQALPGSIQQSTIKHKPVSNPSCEAGVEEFQVSHLELLIVPEEKVADFNFERHISSSFLVYHPLWDMSQLPDLSVTHPEPRFETSKIQSCQEMKSGCIQGIESCRFEKLLRTMWDPGIYTINLDKDLQNGDRVKQDLTTVIWNLIFLRPPTRDRCLQIALQSIIHHMEEVRMKAICLVANKLFPLSKTSQKIEEVATSKLHLVADSVFAMNCMPADGLTPELQKECDLEVLINTGQQSVSPG